MRASIWILACLAGCGDGSGSATPDDAATTNDGTSSDTGAVVVDSNTDANADVSVGTSSGHNLLVQLQLAIRLQTPPSTYALVSALDTVTGKALDGATVTLTPLGGSPITLPASPGIPYQKGFASGWVKSFDLSVTHSAGSRTGIVVEPPSNFTTTITPPPKVNTPSTVAWTPSGEPNVSVYVLLGKYGTPSGTPLPDDGSFLVPATAFPAPAAKGIQLEVERVRIVSVPNAVSMVLQVSVYQLGIDVAP